MCLIAFEKSRFEQKKKKPQQSFLIAVAPSPITR